MMMQLYNTYKACATRIFEIKKAPSIIRHLMGKNKQNKF